MEYSGNPEDPVAVFSKAAAIDLKSDDLLATCTSSLSLSSDIQADSSTFLDSANTRVGDVESDHNVNVEEMPLYAMSTRSSLNNAASVITSACSQGSDLPLSTSDTLVSPGSNFNAHLQKGAIFELEVVELKSDDSPLIDSQSPSSIESKDTCNTVIKGENSNASSLVAADLATDSDVATDGLSQSEGNIETEIVSVTTPALSSFGTYPLYVGDLQTEVTEALLYSIFSVCGPISSVRVCRDTTSQVSLGYAYVNFQSKESAEVALKKLNYTKILDRECRIMPSLSKSDVQHLPSGSNIYIQNLHPSVDSRALFEKFSQYGTVVSCKIVRNKQTGLSLCRGYVQFSSKEDADKAIAFENGKYFGGSCIRIDSFVSKEDRISSFTSKKTPAGILNIRGISASVVESELKAMFDLFGTIHSVYFTLGDSAPIDSFKPRRFEDGRNYREVGSGWGYVNYYDVLSAKIAKSALNNVFLYGSKIAVSERDTQNDGEDTQTQFPIIIRTFDHKINLSLELDPMLKHLFPTVSVPTGSIKIYAPVEGTSLQCASILMDSLEQAQLTVTKINSCDNLWETVVACLAGDDAIKFRRDEAKKSMGFGTKIGERQFNKYNDQKFGNRSFRGGYQSRNFGFYDKGIKDSSASSPTEPASFRHVPKSFEPRYHDGFRPRNDGMRPNWHREERFSHKFGPPKGNYFRSRFGNNKREFHKNEDAYNLREERDDFCVGRGGGDYQTGDVGNFYEHDVESSLDREGVDQGKGHQPQSPSRRLNQKAEEKEVEAPSAVGSEACFVGSPQKNQYAAMDGYYMRWPVDGSLYQQYSMYPYSYMYNQAQLASLQDPSVVMNMAYNLPQNCSTPKDGSFVRVNSMGIPLATPDQVKDAAASKPMTLEPEVVEAEEVEEVEKGDEEVKSLLEGNRQASFRGKFGDYRAERGGSTRDGKLGKYGRHGVDRRGGTGRFYEATGFVGSK